MPVSTVQIETSMKPLVGRALFLYVLPPDKMTPPVYLHWCSPRLITQFYCNIENNLLNYANSILSLLGQRKLTQGSQEANRPWYALLIIVETCSTYKYSTLWLDHGFNMDALYTSCHSACSLVTHEHTYRKGHIFPLTRLTLCICNYQKGTVTQCLRCKTTHYPILSNQQQEWGLHVCQTDAAQTPDNITKTS